MEINTIIFDLDGTLLNTLDDLTLSINFALKSFNYPIRTKEEIKSFVGNGIEKAMIKALPSKLKYENELSLIIETFKKYYSSHAYEQTKPYNGIIEMLNNLKSKGYKLGVVSNKYDKAVKELCNYYFKDLIQVAIGESKEIMKKPDPGGVLKVIKEFKDNIKSSIYIGDSEVDIATANNANIKCISVLWGFRDRVILEKAGGKNFVTTPDEIIKIIEKKIYLS